MSLGRKIAALAAAGVLAGAGAGTVLAGTSPVLAHGAPESPISRVAACGPEGGQAARSAACRAAVAAGVETRQWDNVRVAGVRGRDRELIPDGRLCSAGIDRYRGLDLGRADWPVTRLAPGAEHTFGYRATIPHRGQFRMYVTADGYDPTRALRWSDLEPEPFLTVTDPPLRAGAYRFPGGLPAGKQGRHLIYTVWQNSDTPDTYYSCSDVLFGPAGDPTTDPVDPTAAATDSTGSAVSPQGPVRSVTATATATATADAADGTDWLPYAGGATVVVAAVVPLLLLMRRRTGGPAGAGRHR